MKVVLDTNVLVSALAIPGGKGDEALGRILTGGHELLLSKPILDELLGVMARKFSRDVEELARLAVFLADMATFVKPRIRLRLAADEPDNRILECAVAGGADVVVSGDKALLSLGRVENVRILSVKEFLEEAR